jgi:hypothetical protein
MAPGALFGTAQATAVVSQGLGETIRNRLASPAKASNFQLHGHDMHAVLGFPAHGLHPAIGARSLAWARYRPRAASALPRPLISSRPSQPHKIGGDGRECLISIGGQFAP